MRSKQSGMHSGNETLLARKTPPRPDTTQLMRGAVGLLLFTLIVMTLTRTGTFH